MPARLAQAHGDMGLYASGDDCFLALRGLRTLPTRLARHQATTLTLTRWLAARPEVARVLYPAAGKRSRPCPVETRFFRQLRAVRPRP